MSVSDTRDAPFHIKKINHKTDTESLTHTQFTVMTIQMVDCDFQHKNTEIFLTRDGRQTMYASGCRAIDSCLTYG